VPHLRKRPGSAQDLRRYVPPYTRVAIGADRSLGVSTPPEF
jgi:hypothetical protein